MNDTNSADFWDQLYRSNRYPWDLGAPTPAFENLLEQGGIETGTMLVLGAGLGHDARLFASYGFKVTAVDFAREAVEAMEELQDPLFPIEVVQADFFTFPPAQNDGFDYILDYTSFCAIMPQRRSEYADMVTRLLKIGGSFIILAFPIGTMSGGPPFVVQPATIIELFTERGFDLTLREVPPHSAVGRAGHEELLIFTRYHPE